ncbi:MAG: 50S ribosomal protein L22 [Candidatus Nezhaarchaeota archaeon]|nr:50S ribosomal protein L22 [Candidatus Nezhaarchaeota archaeon]MCX8141898.1 50S ribosomal protein L22 [Candidatus Nezhaarchaeota archaeon]MDW8050321.1 50S ribosomal protein L22 [Nitrososphaerota archaeon]
MPEFGYSLQDYDPDKMARASGRDLRVSWKKAIEVCYFIKGKKLSQARELLEKVLKKEIMIPFTRFRKKRAHHGSVHGYASGGYPIKVVREVLKILRNVETNAENKGLDVEKLVIVHAAAHKGPVIKKYIPRAFGRSTPFFQQLVHIEIAVKEV